MDSSLRLYWKKNWQRKNKKRKGGKKIETTNDSHVYCGKWWIFCSLAHCYLTIKVPRCFRSLKDASRPISVHYLSNSKAWMNSDIMETALGRLDRRMNFENHKVILVLDNAKTVLKQWKIIQIAFSGHSRAFPDLRVAWVWCVVLNWCELITIFFGDHILLFSETLEDQFGSNAYVVMPMILFFW